MSNEGRSLSQSDAVGERRLPRRVLCAATLGLLAGALAIGLGWLAAKSWPPVARESAGLPSQGALPEQEKWPDSHELRVTGASMAPTLLGTHAHLRCAACKVAWPANWQASFRPVAPVICWNCGARVPVDSAVAQSGSLVQLEQLAGHGYRPVAGDLVAVILPPAGLPAEESSAARPAAPPRGIPSLSVKRIVAGPGQRVTHVHGRLLVDDRPIELATIWIPVHDDSHRRGGDSWWEPHPQVAADSAAQITDDGFKFQSPDNVTTADAPLDSKWLIYQHRSVHHGMRPDRVRDDVPGNVTEVRSLLPVERLRLSFRIKACVAGTLEVAFWDGVERVAYRYALGPEVTQLRIIGPRIRGAGAIVDTAAEKRFPEPSPPLLGHHAPVAIGVLAGAAEISQIRIERPLVYRMDERLAATRDWPVVLGPEQYFVLGDNVPLSIDSRHFGPIAGSRIVGRIRPVSYDGPQRSQQ